MSTLHDLRHSCATIPVMAGKHPKYVQELLGRADLSIALGTYFHIVEGMDGGLGDVIDEAHRSRIAAIEDYGSTSKRRIPFT